MKSYPNSGFGLNPTKFNYINMHAVLYNTGPIYILSPNAADICVANHVKMLNVTENTFRPRTTLTLTQTQSMDIFPHC